MSSSGTTLPTSSSTHRRHAEAFQQQGSEIFEVPEEPVLEETVDAFHDEERGHGLGISADFGEGEDRRDEVDHRPWYLRPSPWWMLTLMPLSAMTVAGVSPSLLQIYTEIACKSLYEKHDFSLRYIENVSEDDSLVTLPHVHHLYLETDAQHTNEPVEFYPSIKEGRIEENKERSSCASDPKVQAIVASLLTAMTTTLGVLSCITGASWASLSDRLGRSKVLAISAFGFIFSYSIIVFGTLFVDRIPGGYWFFVIGPIVHGLLGGSATATAATNAYIADCTPASARSRTFSLTLGLRFTGMAAGPTVCAFLVRATGTPLAAPAFVVGFHILYTIVVLFAMPESLSLSKQNENRRAYRIAQVDTEARDQSQVGNESRIFAIRRSVIYFVEKTFSFLRPLSLVKPSTLVDTVSGKIYKDWSLTFIALSAGLASFILASYSTMGQFGAATYGWSAVELGYWFSGIVAARAATLTVILPAIIKLYHYHTSSRKSIAENEPLLSQREDDSVTSSSQTLSNNTTPVVDDKKLSRHSPAFDLTIAQASLALEIVCYGLVPFIFKSSPAYIALTVLASCGAGFGPAIQALAVDLYARRGGGETGRLFGVLSVVQSTSSQIIGPLVYGITYMKIVGVYPQGIFFVSTIAVGLSLLFLFLLNLSGLKGSRPRAVERIA